MAGIRMCLRNLSLKKSIPLEGVGHQNGACGFGPDAKTSVLDLDCRTHNIGNLYVVDGSFFPSCGAVNPSLYHHRQRSTGRRSFAAASGVKSNGATPRDHYRLCRWCGARRRAGYFSSGERGVHQFRPLRPNNTNAAAMFVPQAIMAIVASLLGAGLRSRLGTKRIYLLGLLANLLAMTLLVASRFAISKHSFAYAILLVATSCMGVGFGFTVPALNTLAAAFFPEKVDKAVLGLNALLGLGTALAPVFVALFVGLGDLVGPAGARGSLAFRAARAKCEREPE